MPTDKQSVLIIKHGFSEGIDQMAGSGVHYSDVFRSTCLLEDCRGKHVTWITARCAEDLFLENHLVDDLVLADHPGEVPFEPTQRFDVLINLENRRDWIRFAQDVRVNHRYGYLGQKSVNGNGGLNGTGADGWGKQGNGRACTYQERLYRFLGRQWQGQRWVLGYVGQDSQMYDVGLNTVVAPEESLENWPRRRWQQLHNQLRGQYVVSRPLALDSIREYIDWLAACRVVVTGDSLGLYLAVALGKQVVALVGTQGAQEVYLYGHGIKVTPTTERDCSDCVRHGGLGHCCMEEITVEMVTEAVEMLLEKPVEVGLGSIRSGGTSASRREGRVEQWSRV